MSELKALQSEVDRLHRELIDAKQRLHEAKVMACGVSIGSIVVGTGRRNGSRLFKVAVIDPGFDPPWIKAFVLKKDGKWSAAQRHLFSDWRKATASELPPPSPAVSEQAEGEG